MTNTIILPRSVVEQALEAFDVATTPLARDRQEVLRAQAALRAALEQPQGEVVVTTNQQGHCVAVTRQDEEGRILSVVWESKHPQVEQEPVAWQCRMRSVWGRIGEWWPWQDCSKEKAQDYERVPSLNDWEYESRALYTHPQNLNCKSTQARLATLWGYEKKQSRQPLTDEQINDHRLSLAYDSEDLPDPWDFKQGVKAAERAHGIGGKA